MVNGWLSIYKPSGVSSAKVVAIIKKRLQAKKVGHGGTLDPLACGILPICIGTATKQTSQIMDCAKQYLFNIKFGEIRTTGDEEGEVVEKNDFIPKESIVLKNISSFIGTIKQMPPIYSALKINGKRAYHLAREGKEVILKERDVRIYNLEFIKWVNEREIQLLVECSKGFYVRSMSVDFAKKCNALGYTSYLERISVGNFDKSNSVEIDNVSIENIDKYLIVL